MDGQLVTENLYQIPNCTICLQQLSEDLACLACGHVFHISCITQHFQYRGSCPNCQKRAQQREIRLVIYPIVQNTKAGAHLRNLLATISNNSEGRQVQGLLKQIKHLSQKSQKYGNDVKELQKQNRKKSQQLQDFKRDYQSKSAQLTIAKREISLLKGQCAKIKQEEQKNFSQLLDVREQLNSLLTQKKQYEKYKTWQKIANQNTEELLKFKKEMENNSTAPQDMAKAFFEVLQVKTLNLMKAKQKQRQAIEMYRYKDDQIVKLKFQIKSLKTEVEDLQNQKAKIRKKYEDTRSKFKDYYEKNKARSQQNSQIPQLEDSMSVSIGARFIPKVPVMPTVQKQPTFNVVDKSKNQTKLSFGNMGLKKKAEERQKPKTTLKNFML